MAKAYRCIEWREEGCWVNGLCLIFSAVLLFRFLFPFYFSPFDHLFSDPLRHWDNAKNLGQLTFMGGVDPKGYQFFLGTAYAIFGDNRMAIETIVGLLSAATAFVWLMVAREILPRPVAYIVGLILALLPSGFVIFGYFMNETLLLFLLGLAWWLTFVWWRKRTFPLATLVITLWIAAMITRIVVLPVAVPLIVWMIIMSRTPVRQGMTALLTAVLMLYPCAKFTYDRVGVWTPFNDLALNRVYALCQHSRIDIYLQSKGRWTFESPTYYNEPFAPLSHYHHDKTDSYKIWINMDEPGKGRYDWDDAIEKLSSEFTWRDYLVTIERNVIYGVFAPSWPDSSDSNDVPLVLKMGYWLRWMWAPLILIFIYGAYRIPMTMKQSMMVGATAALLVLFMLQNQGIMEGRFRKPIEPMLILSTAMIAVHVVQKRRGATLIINAMRIVKKIVHRFGMKTQRTGS